MISPTRRGASESAATLPASASTGRPASRARVSVGAPSGSTPTTRIVPPYQAATPPISPPPPTATSSVSRSGTCSVSSAPTRALPEQGLALVERVHAGRARLRGEGLARRQGVGVPLPHDLQVGAVAADPLDLGRGGDRRHEDLRPNAEAHRRVRHRGAVVAARGRDDAGRRDLPRSRLANAPRDLKDPACWSDSSLSVSGNGARPKSAPLAATAGVRRTCGRMTSWAARMAARSIRLVMAGRILTETAAPSASRTRDFGLESARVPAEASMILRVLRSAALAAVSFSVAPRARAGQERSAAAPRAGSPRRLGPRARARLARGAAGLRADPRRLGGDRPRPGGPVERRVRPVRRRERPPRHRRHALQHLLDLEALHEHRRAAAARRGTAAPRGSRRQASSVVPAEAAPKAKATSRSRAC